jgi:hypothetical protein
LKIFEPAKSHSKKKKKAATIFLILHRCHRCSVTLQHRELQRFHRGSATPQRCERFHHYSARTNMYLCSVVVGFTVTAGMPYVFMVVAALPPSL